jgi:putative PIN family toxin of toxin-antitoxin system
VRIVLDTNVFVSALIHGDGPPGRVLAAVRHGGVTLVTSAAQLHELRSVVGRQRLRPYIRHEEAEDLIRNLEVVGEVVTADLPDVNVSPDPDDNLILGTAIAGRADMIVSGDKKHMLSLGHVNGIPIVAAADAADQLGDGSARD